MTHLITWISTELADVEIQTDHFGELLFKRASSTGPGHCCMPDVSFASSISRQLPKLILIQVRHFEGSQNDEVERCLNGMALEI